MSIICRYSIIIIMKTLNFDEKLKLVVGNGMWHSSEIPGKLPSIHLADGPHGLRAQDEGMSNNESYPATCYPAAVTLACSWDRELVERVAASIAEEALQQRVSVLLGPGTNIKRSPLGGRNFEYFSEDPYLAGELGASYVTAVQEKGVATSLKHFAGNSQETRRQTSNSRIDERALREIYLAAFEKVVKKSQPATVMPAYNRLNGEYCCASKKLLTDILRNEWGFEGLVVSDWGACIELPDCIRAGMDLEMPDSRGIHGAELKKAVSTGILDEKYLNRAAGKVSELVLKYAPKGEVPETSSEKQRRVALEAALCGAVLLKNNGALPIKDDKITVVGALAKESRYQGGGSSHVNARQVSNAFDELTKLGYGIHYAAGYRTDKTAPDALLEKEALSLCKSGRTVLLFGGLTELAEGEGFDRKDFRLPLNQRSLINKLLEKGCRLIFVGFGGSPFALDFSDKAEAVLHMMLGGEAVGEATALLLSGRANPCGKLAESYPVNAQLTPCCEYFGKETDDVDYRESIFVGYRYYDSFGIPVRFPFGHGLSYTSFEYDNLSLSADFFESGTLTVSFDVTNTGERGGAEIAQLYVKNPQGRTMRPLRELKGFAKLQLDTGETKRVEIELNERSFSIWDRENHRFVVPEGEYEIQIGASLNDIRLNTPLKVSGVSETPDDERELPAYFIREAMPLRVPEDQFAQLFDSPLKSFDNPKPGEFSRSNSLTQLSKRSVLAKAVKAFGEKVLRIRFAHKSPDDPELRMLLEGLWHGSADAVGIMGGELLPYKIIEAIVLEANGHRAAALKKLTEPDKIKQNKKK